MDLRLIGIPPQIPAQTNPQINCAFQVMEKEHTEEASVIEA